jgi:dTDP-glucose 4,6-dehydratase
MKKLLITGGAGFIGSNFVHYIYKERPDWHLTVFDALTYAGNEKNLEGLDPSRYTFIKANICDESAIDTAIADCDIVVHFAAESHVDNSIAGPWPFIETNIIGTYRILEAVRKHGKRLHHISTDEVFGDLALDAVEKFKEDRAYDPSSPYSASKASSDHLVRAWVRTYNINATLSNCANNYGPRQHVEKLIPRQITNVLTGIRPKLYGKGENIREWTHVDDHNEAVLRILENGKNGETYLIGSGDERSSKEIIEMILELMGQPSDAYDYVPDRPGHDLHYSNDSTKLRTELGWKPKYDDLRLGLKNTIDWYTVNEAWWKPQKTATEAKYQELGR